MNWNNIIFESVEFFLAGMKA